MRVSPFIKITFSIYAAITLSACQLLAPYKGPIAPTPFQWKTTYSAPDAGKPTIPPEWKDDHQGKSPLVGSETFYENLQSETTLDKRSASYNQTDKIDQSQPLQTINHEQFADDNAGAYKPLEPGTEPTPIPTSASTTDPSPESELQPPSLEDVRTDLWNWWEIFQDPVLNELEEQALNSSYTLWAALERVIEARQKARINFAPLLPSLTFAPKFSRTGSLYQNPLPGLGSAGSTNMTSSSSSAAAQTAAASPAALNDFRFIQTQYLVPLNLNYEIDLWSKLNNTYYASLIRAQAASQAYLSILLSLTADVASAYYQVRGLDAQQEVVQRNIRVRQKAVDINRARYNAGLIVYLDVSRAEVELARAHSDGDDVRRARGLQENLLATLIGVPASVFSLPYNPVIIPPPVIPRGIPSELLCRRPDIGEAERNLAAAYRDIGVAYANFFPSLNLNASFGFGSPFASELFSWRSRFWEIGWSVIQTVFDAGRNEANLNYYKAIFSETMANYQQTVLKAFQDVEDSLVNLNGYAKQAQDLAIAVRAARLTLQLAQMRYDRGLTNYLDVVDAERQLLETEQNSVIVLGNRFVSTVMLIRALGGGWGPCENGLPVLPALSECENLEPEIGIQDN